MAATVGTAIVGLATVGSGGNVIALIRSGNLTVTRGATPNFTIGRQSFYYTATTVGTPTAIVGTGLVGSATIGA
jgi:hypothetical protein